MNEFERAANKLQESYDYMDSVFRAKRRPATIELLDAMKCAISVLREKAAQAGKGGQDG